MIEINQSHKELNKTQVMLIENTVFDCFEYFVDYLLESASKNFVTVFLGEILLQKNQSDFKFFKNKFCNKYQHLKENSAQIFWQNVSRMINYINGQDIELLSYVSSKQLHSEEDINFARKNSTDYIKLYSKNLVISKISQYNCLSSIEKEQKVILEREKICKREEKLLDRQEKILEERMSHLSVKINKCTQTEFEDKKPANLVDKCLQVNLNKSLKNQRCKSN